MSLDYIARCQECGNILMWMSEKYGAKEIAKDLGYAVRHGLSVNRMETEECRKVPFGHSKECSLRPKYKKAEPQLF